MIKKKIFLQLFNRFQSVLLLFFAGSLTSYSQTLEMFSSGPSGNGPGISNQTVTLQYNSNNPTGNTIGSYSPAITVTYGLSGQQFSSIEGNSGSPGTQFGGNITTNNSPVPGFPYFPLMNYISSSSNSYYTACNSCTAGTGIDIAANKAISVTNYADALITSTGVQNYAYNARIQFADLTLTFSSPVSNPLIHLTGLGGQTSYSNTVAPVVNYTVGYTSELELVTPGLSLSRVSGNTYFSVSSNVVTNTATNMGANSSSLGAVVAGITRYAASGTVRVNGTNITSITFRTYLKGDGGIITNNSGTVVAPANGNILRWAYHAGFMPGGTSTILEGLSGDTYLIGASLPVPVTVTGNVFNDPDRGDVNSSSGDPIATGMNANLIDANGKVVATTTVNTNGIYTFNSVFEGDYIVNISTVAGVQGTNAPTVITPSGWYTTGEFNGTPNTGNDGTVNGTSASFTVSSTDVSNINFGITQVSLPVTFGDIKANTSAGDLFLTWETLKEINNSHFMIQASSDGKRFTTIGEVATKAADGNSSEKISYSFSKDKNSMAILGFSIALFGFGFSLLRRRNKLVFSLIILAGLTLGVAACSKSDKAPSNDGGKLYIRIIEVDKQGVKQYSKIVEATR